MMYQPPPGAPMPSMPTPSRTSALATASLVMGILAWCLLPIIGAIVAIVTGHMAKSEIRNSMGMLSGDGLATAGLIMGYMQLVLAVIPVCFIALLFLLGPSIGGVFSNIIPNI